jgi:S-methylmethionine-dependent homocysteine/selenocysteine methylase
MFLTDGGLETSLIFHEGFDLPLFSAFTLLESEHGRTALRAYYDRYAAMAVAHGTGFILESPTWRANPDWAAKLGYHREWLAELNRAAVEMMHSVRAEHESARSPFVISGNVGPRGDGYHPGALMRADDAQDYHAWQIGVLKDAGADLVSAFTMTNIGEAVGITCAAKAVDVPCVISFTLETDGKLPTGETLGDAIGMVDRATKRPPAYYMINCAHPTHFDAALRNAGSWTRRLRGIRANASRLSHAELDNSPQLDIGNPQELGEEHAELLRRFPHINVFGGCCGTDHRHVGCIATACRGHLTVSDAHAA